MKSLGTTIGSPDSDQVIINKKKRNLSSEVFSPSSRPQSKSKGKSKTWLCDWATDDLKLMVITILGRVLETVSMNS